VNFVIAGIYAGLISIDRFAAINIMISRPIVIAFILGLLFDNSLECFFIGLVFEAVGLIDVPFGTRIPKEDSFGAFAACILFAVLPIEHSDEFVLGFLLTLLLTFPVTLTCGLTRSLNKKFFLYQQKKGKVKPGSLLAWGLFFAFMRGVIVYGLGTVFIYNLYFLFNGKLEHMFNLFLFSMMIFVFLSGYILRFLTVKSVWKYLIFASGLIAGWIVI